jgi:AP-4 complex subunit epsilon-1
MQLLRVLALLGRGDQTSSEGMYEVLVDVMRRADTGINVGYAIGNTYTYVDMYILL